MTRLSALLLLAASAASAAEPGITLKAVSGHDLVEVNCSICHSLDYIPMNSVFLPQKGWDAEVRKMIKAYGAPIDDRDAQAIIDYLARNYGG